MEKVPKIYDNVSIQRILQALEKRISLLETTKLKVAEGKSVSQDAAPSVPERQWNITLDSGQNAFATIKLNGRLYKVALVQA